MTELPLTFCSQPFLDIQVNVGGSTREQMGEQSNLMKEGNQFKNQGAKEAVNSSMCMTKLSNDSLNTILIIFKSVLIAFAMHQLQVPEAEYSVDFHH